MMAELLPCPFCGGKAFVSAKLPYFGETVTMAVVCEDCNASSKHKRNEEEAIKSWNKRNYRAAYVALKKKYTEN